jgi:hypothetical protein
MTNNSKKTNNTKAKDALHHHRKKSSFFNSEDLRVSKQENFNLGDESTISKNLFNIFAKNNPNKSSNLIEFDNDKNFNLFNHDNSLVKMCESRLEISQNNHNHDTFPSNLTSMISFVNQNNINNNLISSNVNLHNNNNKHIVESNIFDFDLRDSPSLIKFAQDQTFQNYFSLETKSKKTQNNHSNNNLNQDSDNLTNKKTKSVDLLSVSNQININILYSNNKKSDEKTRVIV